MSNRIFPNQPPPPGDEQPPIGSIKPPDEGEPEIPPDPVPSYCKWCDELILSAADGRNLVNPADTREFHIHHRCWEAIPASERFALELKIQQTRELTGVLREVLGVMSQTVQAIRAFHSLVDLAMGEYKHRSSEGRGESEN